MKTILVIIIIAILGGFYWYSWKPTQIRKECYALADKGKQQALDWDNIAMMGGYELTKRADYDEIFNDTYQECLLKNGLEK